MRMLCTQLRYYPAVCFWVQVPHYVTWINVLRGGLNAVLAWVSLICCILTYTVHWEWDEKHHPHWDKHDYRHAMTTVRNRTLVNTVHTHCHRSPLHAQLHS